MSNTGRLHGRRAIVTGAGSGIGEATVRRFAAEGAKVAILDLDIDRARRVATSLPAPGHAIGVDVSDPESVRSAFQLATSALGGLDALVNNAGIGTAGSIEDTELADFERVLAVNLMGTFLCMRAGLPHLRASGGGTIVNIASIAALVGLPERAAYSATKGAVVALNRAAAIDHAAEQIRINAIAPGTVNTPWVQRIASTRSQPQEELARMRARQPHGRLVEPAEIAAMAAYLVSDDAASTVGAVLVVDGGATAT